MSRKNRQPGRREASDAANFYAERFHGIFREARQSAEKAGGKVADPSAGSETGYARDAIAASAAARVDQPGVGSEGYPEDAPGIYFRETQG